jgi:hypothetical protein
LSRSPRRPNDNKTGRRPGSLQQTPTRETALDLRIVFNDRYRRLFEVLNELTFHGEIRSFLSLLRNRFDGLEDPVVRAAAAEVPVHTFFDFVVTRRWIVREQCRRFHDLSRLAVTALRRTLIDPRLLEWMELTVLRQPFNRRDLLTDCCRERRDARANWLAIEVDGAGATLRDAATELGPSQSKIITQDPEDPDVGIGRIDWHVVVFAIDANRCTCHRRSDSL